MNKAFEKLMSKKKASGDSMSDVRQKARSSTLDDLMSNMNDRDSKKLGMKKVSVMADSKEDLKKGLDKAKEIVDQHSDDDQDQSDDDSMPEEGSSDEEQSETPEQESDEKALEQKSPEELI